jgi:DNA end-binding protein Ku
MPRAIWKGQISFGLVNVPVSLYSAEKRNDISLHLVDSRNTGRVRYQRVNEATGEEVPWDKIVKGYQFDGGQYVLLSDEEMKNVEAELTKTIEIEDFVDQSEIDPLYFDKPYYLEPREGGRKGYALLRETLKSTDRVGVARVVIRTKEHLALLRVYEDVLMLNLIRFPQEVRSIEELDVPKAGDEKISMSAREIDMAVQLVENMTTAWEPEKYHDEYRESLMNYINRKIESGELSTGSEFEPEAEETEGEEEKVVDLMDYLKQSVERAKEQKGQSEPEEDSGKSKPKSRSTKSSSKSKAKQKKSA